MTDDAHCQAESGEDPGLQKDGTACVALPLTGPSLRGQGGSHSGEFQEWQGAQG